jgi:prepilin-type N-terminal cleavage/methylation domain-containing protein
MTRRGFTLHEMLISMLVLSGVLGLAGHLATRQLRFFRGAEELATTRDHVAQTGAVAERILWAIAPSAGDVIAATDTALEIRMPVGTAIVCAAAPGRVTVPEPAAAEGNALSAFHDSPQTGDHAAAYLHDSLGASWMTLRVVAAPVGDACATLGPGPGWSIAIAEPHLIANGTVLRFTRPLRLATYRASDGRWYLGAREWNGDSQSFNTIQPVVGPLQPPHTDEGRAGLRFHYADAAGARLFPPFDAGRIASISIITRSLTSSPVRIEGLSRSGQLEDSAAVTVALRNAR